MVDQRTKRRLQRVAASFNARARKYHSPGSVSWYQLLMLGDQCRYCGIKLSLDDGTWDHVVPFERGGANDVTNIVRCCTTDQRSKFTKSPSEHAAAQKLLVTCGRPGCGKQYKPRWAEYQRGMARYCSHACAGSAKGKQWLETPSPSG